MKLKICGLMTLHDIDCVNAACVDYAGFVFTPHRQRISVDTARLLKRALNPAIKTVGVFTDESREFVESIVAAGLADAVQFHGAVEYPLSCPTFRGMRIRTAADIIATDCDCVVFDAFGSEAGSTGGVFDWRLVADYSEKPFFLAGGINITNIEQAVRLNPYGIDISSGVEVGGAKSLEKIMEIATVIQSH
jgi:phosphoribosylanthranilate isomerase